MESAKSFFSKSDDTHSNACALDWVEVYFVVLK